MKKWHKALVIAVVIACLSGLGYFVYGYLDIDGDGLTNNEEKKYHTDAYNPDSDGDGLEDGAEVNEYHTDVCNPDSDKDGLSDGIEVKYKLDPTNASDANEDFDHDFVSNREEILNYTGAIHNPDLPFSGKSDADGDYIVRSIEIENGLDPNNAYSFGELHDFLRLYVYPHILKDKNITLEEFKDMIPNIKPKYWNNSDGGYNAANKYLKLSLVDPIFQYYADKVHIEWKDDVEYGKIGYLKLGNENLFLEYGTDNNKSLVPPVYYLTHGRKGICVESSVANDCIFQHKGYPSTLVTIKINSNISHALGEVKIYNVVYICDYNTLTPKKDINNINTYMKWGVSLADSYDPNWLINGTDRHM